MAGLSELIKPGTWFTDWLSGKSKGSKKVEATSYSILQSAPFWYGINKISGNVGTLPLNVHRKKGEETEYATDHLAHKLLKMRPNAFQSPMVFKQQLTGDAINWGNGRAYIHLGSQEYPKPELIPLCPSRTVTGFSKGEKIHCTYLGEYGDHGRLDKLLEHMEKDSSNRVTMLDRDVIHIMGFGNGVVGYSLFQIARYALEASLGADRKAAKDQTQALNAKVMLQIPQGSPFGRDQRQIDEMLENFEQRHLTNDGEGRSVGALREGITANVLSMSNSDQEFVDTRKFQRQDAALFLMLESILGDDESISYNSEEQKQLAYLKNCLGTWLVRWEQECAYKLLTPEQFYSEEYYCKFNVASLLRTDFPTTIDTLCKGIQHRLWNPNEARGKIDMNPYDGGDAYENPNVSSAQPDNSQETQADDSDMRARIRHMLRIEEKNVSKFLNRGDNFDRIDQWYEKYVTNLADCIQPYGGTFQIAQGHCVRSLQAIKRGITEFKLDGSEDLIIQEIKDAQV